MKNMEWKTIFPKRLQTLLNIEITDEIAEELQEIRIRHLQHIFVKTSKKSFYIADENSENLITKRDIDEMLAFISNYSLYAFEDELKQGYITLNGGHRVGFCGKAVMKHGEIVTLRQISSINIRIAREVKGCAAPWMPYLFDDSTLYHTLIVSPPACGKTTLLRDFIRLLSEQRWTVGVVDERGEIAAMKDGVAQMDIGPCTDVQENAPKSVGMQMLLRSMSPDIIAVDELGEREDIAGVEAIVCAGVVLLCTVHGRSMEELSEKPYLKELLDKKIFGRYLFLSTKSEVGTVESILDKNGQTIYKRGEG